MSRFKRLFQSSNPLMKEETYQRASSEVLDNEFMQEGAVEERMTVAGAINKTFLLFGIMMITAIISYAMPNQLFLWGGAIGGLIVVFIAASNVKRSPTLAPIYAALEGLFVGTITAYYAYAFDGIIFQAVTLTMAMLFLMLFIYKSGLVKVTEKFRAGVMMATGAVLIVYLINIVLSFFGMNVPYLHEGGAIGIGISLLIIGIAAVNLLLDFDNFEKGEAHGAPIYMEWFSAMGLLITLVWLYIEILRLLAIFYGDE